MTLHLHIVNIHLSGGFFFWNEVYWFFKNTPVQLVLFTIALFSRPLPFNPPACFFLDRLHIMMTHFLWIFDSSVNFEIVVRQSMWTQRQGREWWDRKWRRRGQDCQRGTKSLLLPVSAAEYKARRRRRWRRRCGRTSWRRGWTPACRCRRRCRRGTSSSWGSPPHSPPTPANAVVTKQEEHSLYQTQPPQLTASLIL